MENTSISRVLSLFMKASLSIAGILFVPIKCFKTNNIKSKIQLGSTTPNDTYFSDNQWAYSSTSLENAWDISLGNNDITVAVIDTGVKTTHHELIDNINKSFLMSAYDLDLNILLLDSSYDEYLHNF